VTIDARYLLRRLQPAVPPGHPEGISVRRQPTLPYERRSFDDLIALVSTGQIETGRPVGVDSTIQDEWTDDDRRRLAAAADLAEAHGARRAVLVMDGRGFLLDVAGRQLTDDLATGEARILDVDAAVQVASPGDAPPPAGPTGLPPASVSAQLVPTTKHMHLEKN